MPPAYDPDAVRMPNVRCYRQTSPERPDEQPPAWLGELPKGRPVVLAALGTQSHNVPGRVEALLAALAGVECSAIVAVGQGKDPEDPGYRARARAMQRRILALTPLDRLVADAERLVAAGVAPSADSDNLA